MTAEDVNVAGLSAGLDPPFRGISFHRKAPQKLIPATIWPNPPPRSLGVEGTQKAVVTWPNGKLEGLGYAVPVGFLKLILLNALIISPRSSTFTRSVIWILFTTLKSKRVSPGPVRKML